MEELIQASIAEEAASGALIGLNAREVRINEDSLTDKQRLGGGTSGDGAQDETSRTRPRRASANVIRWVEEDSSLEDSEGTAHIGDVPMQIDDNDKLAVPVPSSPSGSAVSDGDPPGYIPPMVNYSGGAAIGGTPNGSGAERSAPSSAKKSDGPKRSFEELEDITFASPKSFAQMAFDIATSRAIHLLVTDDRTHKSTSAYMHITCSQRKNGCPMILKLTKAREGGWVVKGARANDVDPKQRSVYRCRHSGSAADLVLLEETSTGSTSYPIAGVRPKAAKPKKKKRSLSEKIEPVIGKLVPRRESRPPNSNGSYYGSSTKDEESPRAATFAASERALAPPFERSVSLQHQIAPVLSHDALYPSRYPPPPPASYSLQGKPPPPSVSGSAYPSPLVPPLGSAFHERAGSYNERSMFRAPYPFPPSQFARHTTGTGVPTPPPHGSMHATHPSPAHPPSSYPPPRSSTLSQWNHFLSLLDPELTILGPIMASPHLAVTPASFMSEDENMRMALIDDTDMPKWPKIKLKGRLKAKGVEVWRSMNASSASASAASSTASSSTLDPGFVREKVGDETNGTPANSAAAMLKGPLPALPTTDKVDFARQSPAPPAFSMPVSSARDASE